MQNKKQNEISHIYLQGSDLAEREQDVLRDASEKLGFEVDKISGRSSWWGSKEIGAFFAKGSFKGQEAVLKIQGVKPTVSEAYNIRQFERTNKSTIVRPPKIYAHLPWNEEKRYEALVLEPAGKKIVSTPTNQEEIKKFFEAYVEYRSNCLNTPWLNKPEQTASERIKENFDNWIKSSFKLFSKHPFREKGDQNLIEKGVSILIKEYQETELEFMHGHFSEADLYEKDGQIVLLSNLYWGYRPTLYDAIFGMHWFILHLVNVEHITPEKIEEQRKLWINEIENLEAVKENENFYRLALLERAAAGLNLDALSVGISGEIAQYLVESTRDQVKMLISELSS
ncbi:MAG: hypothetical protein A3B38_04455 [Candidatus Levybacteria bacterium RIFCSPLOWO2_01_FULL_36_13]|nr:MAG: hypothetical protein A2684_00205 [Candidatus Levybacteria bacterium RIFCSPHIGHO2_01_FULL_36_15b]OGH34080.1 MAG: hypothetical protein A3B38_04455 [Candidatus Levybacteria bacterium RIFCSPLOWO2_01_FULL_36_13]